MKTNYNLLISKLFILVLFFFSANSNAQDGRLPTKEELDIKMQLQEKYKAAALNNPDPSGPKKRLGSVTNTNHLLITGPEQDCDNSTPVCQQSYTQTNSYTGFGSQEVSGSSCLASRETNSVWYTFTVQNSGTFTFLLNTANDYDFALYNITAIGCSGVPTATPVRCNYSATYGNTGLTLPASATATLSVGAGGSPTMAGLNVTAGQTFALIIDNYSANTNGYTLTFGGTAQIFDNTPPTLSTINYSCISSLNLNFSEPVQCGSIIANGTDFTISGPSGNVPVTSASGNLCATGASFTNFATVNFNTAGMATGTYTVTIANGSDGNTILDKCGNAMSTSQSLTFQYLAPLSISASTAIVCSGDPTTLTAIGGNGVAGVIYSWAPGGGSSDNITVNPTATSTYIVTASYGSCSQSASQVITVSQPPIVSVNPSVASLCSGTTNILASATMNGAVCTNCNYVWTGTASQTDNNVASSTITGAGPGTYSVTVSSSSGCIGNTAISDISIISPSTAPTCNIMYVSTAGGGSGLTPTSPTTLVNALSLASCNSIVIKMQTGTYNITSPITNVGSYVTIEGGYDATFSTKSSLAGATTIFRDNTNIQGLPQAGRLVAFEISNASYFRLQDLTIQVQAPAAATIANPYGVSTYGVYLNNCSEYDIVRCQIIAGNASAGLNGVDGTTGAVGAVGTKGGDSGGNNCAGTDGDSGSGGNGGGNPGSGAAGVTYNCAAPTNGAAGTAGAGRNGGGGGAGGTSRDGSGTAGAGGNGGAGGGGTAGGTTGGTAVASAGCGTPINGIAGANGSVGANGSNGLAGTAGSVAGGYWNAGSQGGNGTDGAGGGGGKGASGGAGDPGGFLCSIAGTGGGSGGGGGGGQGGTAGTGGYGGGSSYCLFLIANGVNGKTIDCSLTVGSLGAGGTGGNIGNGANGGIGGARGCADACTGTGEGNGAKGGDGGKGGNGGSGGAGMPGESIVAKLGSGSALSTSTTLNLAAQPVITVDNKSCTNVNIDHSTAAGAPSWTSFGSGSAPASGAGSPVSTMYSTVGRKTITMNANNYTDFNNILVAPPSTGTILASATAICPGIVNFASSTSGVSGLSYVWSVAPAGATINSPTTDTTSITFPNASASVITYTVTLTISSQCCGQLIPLTQTITVSPIPADPTASVNAVCTGGTADFTATSPVGSLFNWYDAASSGNLLASGTTYSQANISTPTTVYLQATNAGGCSSAIVPVSVTPTAIQAPTTNSVTSCDIGNIVVSLNPVTGVIDYNWFSDAAGTVSVQTGSNLSYGENILVQGGSFTVYVQSVVPGCTSSALVPVTGSVSNNPIALAQTISPNDTVCINTPVTITLTPSGGDGTFAYVWSPVVNLSNSITQSIAASTSYSVTISSDGCSKIFSFPIIVKPFPADTILTPASITCTSPSIILDGSHSASGAGITYNWTTTGGSITSGTINDSATVNAAGTYYLTVTDNSTGCSSIDSTVVTGSTTPPTAQIAAPAALDCLNSSIILDGSASSSGVTISYNWTTTGGAIVSGGTTNSATVSAAGTYTLTVNSTNGCSTTSSVTVINNSTPPNASAGNDTALTCTLTTLVLQGASTITNPGFTWAGPGIVSGGGTANPTINAVGTYTVTVTDPANSCTNTSVVQVTNNNTPPSAFAGNDTTLTCTLTSLVLQGSSTVLNPGFNWAGPAIVSNGGTANPTINATGTYTVTVTDPANGCTNTSTVVVNSNNTIPNANAGSNQTLTCTVTSVNLNGSSTTANASFSWTGGTITSGGTTATPTVTSAATYTVTVTDPLNGCTNTSTVVVNSNSVPPTADAGNVDTLSCTVTTLSLNGALSTGASSFSWSGPGIVSGGNTSSPTVNAAGTYTLTVTSANSCTAIDSVVISSAPAPLASFASNPATGVAPLTVSFSNTSQNANTFMWLFGDGQSSILLNPTDIYTTAGTYNVLLIASDNNFCPDTATTTIIVLDNYSLIIPNIFTPNGDGFNDQFRVIGTGVSEINTKVFDRWGLKLAEWNNLGESWDGYTTSGVKEADGTYYYVVIIKSNDGKDHTYTGFFQLLR